MPASLPLPGPTLKREADGSIVKPKIYDMISGICPPLPILMCAGMRGKLPDVVKLPPSVTVPFSSFEEALKQRENKDVAQRLEAAVKAIPSTNAEEKLRKCRDIVMEVRQHGEGMRDVSCIQYVSRRKQHIACSPGGPLMAFAMLDGGQKMHAQTKCLLLWQW